MANRILRDWTDSDKVNLLSAEAERFFTRLIMKADDFGYFHAHPSLLIAALFPLKIESVKSSEIDKWIRECEFVGLIYTYEVNERKYLQIKGFKQRLRNMVSKFPRSADNPPPVADNPPSLRGHDADNPPLETKGSRNEDEVEDEEKDEKKLPPKLNHGNGEHWRSVVNSEIKLTFRKTVTAKFQYASDDQINLSMLQYPAWFDLKFPDGGTKKNFTSYFQYYIENMKSLPSAPKQIQKPYGRG